MGDRILGLNTGADDHLPKPFDLDELEARVQALARRRTAGSAVGPGESAGSAGRWQAPRFCGLLADSQSTAAYHHGQPLDLAPREAALLRALLARPGQAVAKERLFDQVFAGEPDVQADAIEVVAYRLRKKLAGTAARRVTLRGRGYLLRAEGWAHGLGATAVLVADLEADRSADRAADRSCHPPGALWPARTVDAQPPAAGHLAAGGCPGGAQHLAPVQAGPARGRYRLRPHPAGLGPGDR